MFPYFRSEHRRPNSRDVADSRYLFLARPPFVRFDGVEKVKIVRTFGQCMTRAVSFPLFITLFHSVSSFITLSLVPHFLRSLSAAFLLSQLQSFLVTMRY